MDHGETPVAGYVGSATGQGFQPSATLKSRSFIGLLLSQFLAAFNDQASHIVALFYATDMLVRFAGVEHVDSKTLISIVTACFIMPFFLFSPLAGILADKYSKRSIVVFWKVAEVVIMSVGLLGFWLPHAAGLGLMSAHAAAITSSILVISVVFLMGTHSAFFIPAKYGMMPEILHTSVLSRGNGLLEGTSFTANILGTVIGAQIYFNVKSTFETVNGASVLHPGKEWIIGVVLLTLAVIGTIASFLVERIPAAMPNKQLVFEPWTPMKQNLKMLRKSRPLVLATIGIAFFLFMTLFLRQSLLFLGETAEEIQVAKRLEKTPAAMAIAAAMEKVDHQAATEADPAPDAVLPDGVPQAAATPNEKETNTEYVVAVLLGLVGLGVGIGCALAGYFSGNRLELGLVPIGIVLLIVMTAIMAVVSPSRIDEMHISLNLCLLAVGAAAGLYIVPLYTLLQHRAPKDSKGSLVATSNFFNVTGGLVAVIVFFIITTVLQSVLGLTFTLQKVKAQLDLVPGYIHQLERATQIPKLLFLSASGITVLMLGLVWWQRPDFVLRGLSWLRSRRRRHLRALGLSNIPANGQVILVSNSHDLDHWVHVVSTVDRFTRFVAPPETTGDKFLRGVAMTTGVMIAANRRVRLSAEDNALARGLVTLGQGYILGMSLAEDFTAEPGAGAALLSELRAKVPAVILPVYCGEKPIHPEALRRPELHTYVVIGEPLSAETALPEIRAAVAALGT
jgi:acyl-[acyl-carrier-protein]-phospholipid O-acyltransferase/long-chain-fatty-acid--[acyl-carrier-protein] ligase